MWSTIRSLTNGAIRWNRSPLASPSRSYAAVQKRWRILRVLGRHGGATRLAVRPGLLLAYLATHGAAVSGPRHKLPRYEDERDLLLQSQFPDQLVGLRRNRRRIIWSGSVRQRVRATLWRLT